MKQQGTVTRFSSASMARAVAAAAAVTMALGASAQQSQEGEWIPLFDSQNDWPVEGIHAVLTTDGKVLIWGRQMCEVQEQDTHVWDPVGDTMTESFPCADSTCENFYCGGHALLADGRILVVGGGCHSTHDKSMTFTVGGGPTGPWAFVQPMNMERWYPTLTTLADGRVLAASGQDAMAKIIEIPEVYDPANNTWTTLSNATRTLDLYPLMFVAPDGRVSHAGRDTILHGFLDVDTQTWSDFLIGPGFGADSSAVMYEPGKILKSGGTVGGLDSATIDLNVATPSWGSPIQMNVLRQDHDLTVLPTGHVLAVGGHSTDLRAEWIDPNDSQPQWQPLAATNAPREYHSTTLLLRDGTVLASGGGLTNAEIFMPPYLFTGTERPIIGLSPRSVEYGETFRVSLGQNGGGNAPQAADIAKVVLIRNGAITHGFDQNQRLVNLVFSEYSANTLEIHAPASGNDAPPGHYMMFVVSNDVPFGVPSVASVVRIVPAE